MDPWTCELIVVRDGSHLAAERRSLSRDVERGLLLRPRRGVHVERAGYLALTDGERHIVLMRAFAAVAPEPPVFSHWSAASVHALPFLGGRPDRVDVTVASPGRRGLDGVTAHLFPLDAEEVVAVGPLLITSAARTVVDVDVAGAASFEEGVVIADGALHAGCTRADLLAAADRAAFRRSRDRIGRVVRFAHEGGHSAAESASRVTQFRLGIAPLELQHEVWDEIGLAGVLDFWSRRRRVGGEVDGAKKYLDPTLARQGAGRAVYDEKLREDRMRRSIEGLARWGWAEARSTVLLGPILARVGIVAAAHRATFDDYCAAARDADGSSRRRAGRLVRR